MIFLPKSDPADSADFECEPAPPAMSAFAFMSFALAVVNGVIRDFYTILLHSMVL